LAVKFVECLSCGSRRPDGMQLVCCPGALLRSVYKSSASVRPNDGVWRFIEWLPVKFPLGMGPAPSVFKSEALGAQLGLENLWLSFSGYWPERGARFMTGSFKELEAGPSVARAKERDSAGLVLASTGNTARAFAYYADKLDFPVLIVVPGRNAGITFPADYAGESVTIAAVENADYGDCIRIAEELAEVVGLDREGGALSIARRDGMATVLLQAAHTMGRVPDHYFQGVGSGAGAIATWEAARRLRKRFPGGPLHLHLAQNRPFVPMYEAWLDNRRQLAECDFPTGDVANEMYTTIIHNCRPAYSLKGGIYDCVTASGGSLYAVDNDEAAAANAEFEQAEGIDIMGPAAVALGALKQALKRRDVRPDEHVLLNVTGGGLKRLAGEAEMITPPADVRVGRCQAVDQIAEYWQDAFSGYRQRAVRKHA
jgi:cysteate synthase